MLSILPLIYYLSIVGRLGRPLGILMGGFFLSTKVGTGFSKPIRRGNVSTISL